MTIRRTLLGAMLVASEAHGQVAMSEQPGHVTEAKVTLDAPPAEVYAAVTDYARWRELLSDVTSVRVVAGGRDDAKVRLASRALEHTFTIQFENIPDLAIRFRGIEGPPGGRARGEYWLEPVDGGTRTRVTARLYLDVVGPVGWLVTDARVRGLREAKLRIDLLDLQHHFSR